MANVINIMQDPDTLAPTYQKKATAADNKIRFVCHSASPPTPAETFVIVFENNFATISKTGAIVFTSTATGINQQCEVELIAKNLRPPKPEGYKFTVVMNGLTWDPRIVPNRVDEYYH